MAGGAMQQQQPPVQPDPLRRFRVWISIYSAWTEYSLSPIWTDKTFYLSYLKRQVVKSAGREKSTVDTQVRQIMQASKNVKKITKAVVNLLISFIVYETFSLITLLS